MDAIPRSVVENYTRAINLVSEQSRAGLADALAQIDMTQDVATVREQVIAAMDIWCGGSTDMAAQLAAEYYDGIRELELGARMGATATSGRDAKATEGAVRAFADKLVKGEVEQFVNLCLDRLDYETKVAASQTVLNNAKRDRRKPKFARVPSGSETCDFCLMLASRGFVYHTEAAASHAHSGCDCRVTPSWKAHKVEGYDEDEIYDRWQDAIDAKAKERAERNGTSVEDEHSKIMGGYARSAAKARGRSTSGTYKRYQPEKSPRFVSDDKAKKQAQVLLRNLGKEKKEDTILRIIKAEEQWRESTHSVDMDNYFATRVGRAMVEHAISLQELEQYTNAYYAGTIG